MLPENWTRQQYSVGFFRKLLLPKCLVLRTQKSINLLQDFVSNFLGYLPGQRQSQELQRLKEKQDTHSSPREYKEH